MFATRALPNTALARPGDLPAERLRSLGFREHPFLASADPRFLYLSGQHLSVVDRLQDLIVNREGFGVVEGPLGTGKTSVARRLLDIFGSVPGFRVVYIHTAEYKTALVALQDIARHFDIARRRAHIDQLRTLEKGLVDIRAEGAEPVVIIDDAQRMAIASLDALHALYNFELHDKVVQVILFAQPEFHGKIESVPSVFSRVTSWQVLSNLPANEALAMISFRCQTAGRDAPLFTDSGFLKLYHSTQGVPRQIVSICSDLLHLLARDGKNTADAAEVDEAIARYQLRDGDGRTKRK